MGNRGRAVRSSIIMMLLAAAAGPSRPWAGTDGAEPHRFCGDCHLASEETAAEVEATPREPGRAGICLRCHEKVVGGDRAPERTAHRSSLSAPGATVTAPAGGREFETFDCLSCHDPHARRTPYLLRGPAEGERIESPAGIDAISAFCIACHPLTGDFARSRGRYSRHPVGMTTRTPGAQGEVVTCVTCHEVHASPNSFLLRWSPREAPAACMRCHRLEEARPAR